MRNYSNLLFSTRTSIWQLMLGSLAFQKTFCFSFKWLEMKNRCSCVLQWTQPKTKWTRENQISCSSLLMIQITFWKQEHELTKWPREKCSMSKFMIDQKSYFKQSTLKRFNKKLMKTEKSQVQRCSTSQQFLQMVDSFASITWKIDTTTILLSKSLSIKLVKYKDMVRWLRRNHSLLIQLETSLMTSFRLNSKEKSQFKTYLNIVSTAIHTSMIILNASLITQTPPLERLVRMGLYWQTAVKLFSSQLTRRSFTLKIKTSTKNLTLLYRRLLEKLKRCNRSGLVNQM